MYHGKGPVEENRLPTKDCLLLVTLSIRIHYNSTIVIILSSLSGEGQRCVCFLSWLLSLCRTNLSRLIVKAEIYWRWRWTELFMICCLWMSWLSNGKQCFIFLSWVCSVHQRLSLTLIFFLSLSMPPPPLHIQNTSEAVNVLFVFV